MSAASPASSTTGRPVGFDQLSTRDFRTICELMRTRAGIELSEAKRPLAQTRLSRRLRALKLTSFAQYMRLLEDPRSSEHTELINALTTNVTAFFREAHHFELLGRTIQQVAARSRRLRIWSAGCSSGEEPWSMAMVIRETLGAAANLDIKVLATDIDTNVLEHAREGVYVDDHVEPVSAARRKRFFTPAATAGSWRIADELRDLVTFKQLNLFEPWPMKGPFDLIFCRNVIIYFNVPNKMQLLRRYHDLLAPGGILCLGHSESITAGVDGFSLIGRTAYRRQAP